MSNNNLYNILANFNKLTPAEKPVETTPKEKIYESVEARGSVAEGLSKIEARLAETFAKEGMATRDSQGPEAVAYQAGYQDGKRHTGGAVVPKGFGAHTDQYVRGFNDAKNLPAEGVAESIDTQAYYIANANKNYSILAGPFASREQGRAEFQKIIHQYPGDLKDLSLLQGHVLQQSQKDALDEPDSKEPWHGIKDPELLKDLIADAQVMDYDEFYDEYSSMFDDPEEFWDNYHNGEQGVAESKVDEDYKHKGKAYGGAAQKDDEDEEDDKPKEKKGVGRPKNEPKVGSNKEANDTVQSFIGKKPKAEVKGKKYGFTAKEKAEKKKGKKVGESHSKLEARFRELLGESVLTDSTGSTLDHIANKYKRDIKDFEATGNLSTELFDTLYDYYQDDMPYGVQKARSGDPHDWIADRITQDLGLQSTSLSPWEQFKSRNDAARVKSGMEPTDWSKHPNFDEAAPAVPGRPDHGGIPGNVPIKDKLAPQKNWEMPMTQDEGVENSMESELDELAKLAGLKIADEGNAFTGKLANTPKGEKFELDGKTYKDTSTLDEGTCPTCDCKPCKCNEGNEFSGELAKAKMQHKDSFNVDGKTYPVKEASIPTKQTFVILDPALIDKIAEMDATEVEPDSDGKGATVSSNNPNVTAQLMSFAQKNPQRLKVTQAMAIDTKRHAGPVDNNWGKPQPTTLEDIAKLSGIAVEGRDYGDASFNEPAHFDNSPEPEVMDADVMLKGGDGEVAGKQKAMHPNKPTFKNGDNPLSKPTKGVDESADPLESLGRRLLKAYESIKIQK